MSEDYKLFSQALRRLLARPQLREKFMELETSDGVLDDLKVSADMASELKLVLTAMPANDPGDGGAPTRSASGTEMEGKAVQAISSAEAFLDQSFAQLRSGARVLMVMSVTMFVIGVAFLVAALIRSFTNPESVQVTAIIAGIGVAQVVLLFYRNPLRDIGRSISNSQQAKMTVMSYMLGVTLINRSLGGTPTEKEQLALATLTRQALGQLDRFMQDKASPEDEDEAGAAAEHPAQPG